MNLDRKKIRDKIYMHDLRIQDIVKSGDMKKNYDSIKYINELLYELIRWKERYLMVKYEKIGDECIDEEITHLFNEVDEKIRECLDLEENLLGLNFIS